MRTFKHSGDLGDIIYSLPTVRALGGGVLFLDPDGGFSNPLVKWADRTRTKLTAGAIRSLMPVLEQQEYINSVELWDGRTVDHDLDNFRSHHQYNNLADAHLAAFNLPFTERDQAWLTIANPKPLHKPTIVARSVRYHSNFSFWESTLPALKDTALFVGYEKEHEIFEYTFGREIEYYKTASMLELAEVIAGATLLVCNEGFPRALAEGLKKSVVVELYRIAPGTIFKRPGAQYV